MAKSAPDGYTLLLAGSTIVAIPHLYRSIPYDTINDFTPIAGIARNEFILVVHPSLPVNTVRQLTALAKEKPGELNYATSSTGGPTHLGAVQFEMLAGVKMQQIPYKGGGPAMSDLVGGQVQLGFANPASAMALVKAGRLKAIAVTGEKRLETLPQVPTFEEGGLPGLALRNWYAITAPAGSPKAVVNRLSVAILKISTMPDIKAAPIGHNRRETGIRHVPPICRQFPFKRPFTNIGNFLHATADLPSNSAGRQLGSRVLYKLTGSDTQARYAMPAREIT